MARQGTNVGGIYYDVTADTAGLLQAERRTADSLRRMGDEGDRFSLRFGAVALAVKTLVVALGLLKAAKVADEMRLLNARVEVAAGSIERGAEAMAELQRISARTSTALADNVTVFNRLNPSLVQMGGNTQDTLRLVELLGKAIKVSGASAAEQASAMTQFGQALGSGKLAGDELRSLLENAPYLMQQLANGLGVPIGALKSLGEQGKLTADVVVAALGKAAQKIEADFKKLPLTFDAAMVTLIDQLRQAGKAADDLTGTSAALTGVAKGAAEAVGLFADEIKSIVTEADKLGRNGAIKSWSDATVEALTYVADAADVVWQTISVLSRNVAFVFKTAGDRIGNLAAQGRLVLKGDLQGAEGLERDFRANAATRRQELDAADARTLSGPLLGERIRQRRADTEAARRAEDRGFTPNVPGSKLTATGGDSDAAKAAKKAADERLKGYLAEVEGLRRIEEEQSELTAKFYADEQAKAEKAAKDRTDGYLEQLAAEQKIRDEQNELTRQFYEEQERQRQQDIARQEQYQQYTLQMAGNLASQFLSILERSGKERTAIGKAAFLAERAIAVATIIMNTEVAAARALNEGGTFGGIPLASLIRGLGYASAGLVAGQAIGEVSGGRRYGGGVQAGSLWQVNETGQPEMFVGSGGRQYMMPTTDGRVVPADKVGGSGAVLELRVINQHPGAQVTQRTGSDGSPELVISEVAAQIAQHRGPVWGALAGSTNVRARL